MKEEIKYQTLSKGLMVKGAWRIGIEEGKTKVTEELERKDLNLLNMALQMGQEFITPSKKINPGFHTIALVNHDDKEIYAFMVDLAKPKDKTYSGETTTKITFTREALQDKEFFEQMKAILGFESDELKTLENRIQKEIDHGNHPQES